MGCSLEPLYSEPGSHAAAAKVLALARRAAGVPSDDERLSIVRASAWSKLNVPLIWAAVDGDEGHPILDWLVRASSGSQLLVPAIAPHSMHGPTAVREAWLALSTGLRLLGIYSRHAMVHWLVQHGYGTVASGGYLSALVQVALIGEAHAALHGNLDDCIAPALEDAYIGV
eukprot:2746046-Karenia_brevis.AAC.1